MVDPLNTINTILKDNWVPGNTDEKTPKFIKITDIKRYNFGENQDIVIAQRPTNNVTPAGIGEANKHEVENFNIDIRVKGVDNENHWLNVIEEIKRILQLKKINPSSDYLILEFDGAEIDLSNKTFNLWRKLLPVQLKRYNVDR